MQKVFWSKEPTSFKAIDHMGLIDKTKEARDVARTSEYLLDKETVLLNVAFDYLQVDAF